MSNDEIPVDFGDVVIGEGGGKYECPICHDFRSDSVRSVKGHISGTRDDQHPDLGKKYEDEIKRTSSENNCQNNE
ncbi:hypothetical protein [Halobellus rufus]|uniref:hypothetical protein n=1 Tax=Halobellus rufus TaxID=1448860 RepID=UPI0012E02625|nr:hypothetical protein [Halobellus rufus]